MVQEGYRRGTGGVQEGSSSSENTSGSLMIAFLIIKMPLGSLQTAFLDIKMPLGSLGGPAQKTPRATGEAPEPFLREVRKPFRGKASAPPY